MMMSLTEQVLAASLWIVDYGLAVLVIHLRAERIERSNR